MPELLTEAHITEFMRTFFRMRYDVLLGDIHQLRAQHAQATPEQEEYYKETLNHYDDWFCSLITRRIMNYPQVNPLLAKEEVEGYFFDALALTAQPLPGEANGGALDAVRVVVREVAPIVVNALSPDNDAYFYFQKLIGIVSRIAVGTLHPFTEFVTTQSLYDVAIRNFMKYDEFLAEHERCIDLFFDSVSLSAALNDFSEKMHVIPELGSRVREGFIGDLMFMNAHCGLGEAREIARKSIWRAAVRIYSSGSFNEMMLG